MKIEIREKGSDAFYREVVNAAVQYRSIQKKHDRKLADYFKRYRRLLILCAAMVVLLAVTSALWGLDTLDVVLIALLSFEAILCGAYCHSLNKLYRTMREDTRASVFTLDENGVELNKADSQILRIGWNSVGVVRRFSESLCFFSADPTGMIIAVNKQYEPQIAAWLRENRPDVEIL